MTETAAAADGNDASINSSDDGKATTMAKQDVEEQTSRNIPWQMEWKRPQWIPSQTAEQADENDNAVVGIASAMLSPFEISQILSHGNSKNDPKSEQESHYLLTVTLLGTPTDENTKPNESKTKVPALAAEVLLEVMEVPSHERVSGVICSKRLRWPESIFDTKPQSAPRAKRQRKKRKNLLASVFLPLMGIDERDEYGNDDEHDEQPEPIFPPSRIQPQQQPTIGIVSATLCRRPGEDLLQKSKKSVTKDIVELMSFGGDGGMIHGENSDEDDRSGDESTSNSRSDSRKEGDADIEQEAIGKPDSNETSCGELSFVCVSQAGEVFVYDPIKLLLGIEKDLRQEERDAAKSLEGASNFFFGQELFRNLQETWKPLAEPSTRIHLSIFEHDQKKNKNRQNPKTNEVESTLVQSNKEIVDLASQSRDTQSAGGSKKKQQNSHNRPVNASTESETSSVSSFGDGSIATSATDALTVVQTMAQELQTNVDEALSVLPYLLNPLLEPSTLKDRTVQNKPHTISVTGNSYVVVTGSGLKRKEPPMNLTKPSPETASVNSHVVSSHGGPQKPVLNEGGTMDSKEVAGSSLDAGKGINANEQKTLGNTISVVSEEVKEGVDKAISSTNNPFDENNSKFDGDDDDENKITEKASWWEDHSTVDEEGNPNGNTEDTNKMVDMKKDEVEGAEKAAWWEDDSADDDIEYSTKVDGAEETKIAGVTENEELEENDSASDQEDSTSEKASEKSQQDILINNDEENSQRHYFDGYMSDSEGDKTQDRGGFVTFLSTARWSETRTLFLPFVPIRTSHISKWNGMELLWVIGEFESLLIRMDSTGPVPVRIGDIMYGGEVSGHDTDLFQTATTSDRTKLTGGIGSGNELSPLSVKRFQVLPIDLGTTPAISPRLLCASNTGIDPPSILELHVDNHTRSQNTTISEEVTTDMKNQRFKQALVLLKTLGHCTPQGTVVLRHAPSHVAKIIINQDETDAMADNVSNERSILAEHGQGWSLVGFTGQINFICWEGSTLLQGAYVQELNHSPDSTIFEPFHTTHILPLAMAQVESSKTLSKMDEVLDNTGVSNEKDQVFETSHGFSSAVANLPLLDEFRASLSPLPHNDLNIGGDAFSPRSINGVLSDPSKSTGISRRQYSEYLLQQCSSWTQLEDTLNDRIVLERQEPVLCLRSGKAGSPHSMLSLRQFVVENGVHSPFQQILAWLTKRKNFFVAAGIALDLLQDGDSLYHLWKNAEMIDEEDEETKLFGLLDGIAPVRLLDDDQTVNEHKHSVTATHLSDMTVGCFIKGGATMAKTLERFLEFNESYDPTRVSLMLSLTAIDLFSNTSMGLRSDSNIPSQEEELFEELVWPIKCLLSVGTEREYLHEVLTLLNNTIPDELRNRHSEDEKEEVESPATSLALTKNLIQLILESDALALEILMGFVDERSQTNFWQSLDHATRLALSLMEINSSFPFLRHPDVRTWAREELDFCFQGQSDLPTAWLQQLTFACLQNAMCEFNDLLVIDLCNDPPMESEANDTTGDNIGLENLNTGGRDNPIQNMKLEIEKTRNALLTSADKGYRIDYDLLIPSLLLLEHRKSHWIPLVQLPTTSTESTPSEDSCVPTRSLLNAACHLAGRAPGRERPSKSSADSFTTEEPFLFAGFDGKSAMKQCYQVKNVVAGAYLIGGRNGFILHVCDVLNRGIGISIPNAESFLLSDRLDLKIIEESQTEGSSFELTSGHQKLLLLLEEHVLGIKTFGDFDFAHNRGKVDPVFAARSILRAWLSLSLIDKASASSWLGEWLGDRLGIASPANAGETPRSKNKANDGSNNPNTKQDPLPNKHRLACASLARSLLWPNNQSTPKMEGGNPAFRSSLVLDQNIEPLASTMKFEKKILIDLCQSCLGLVESVPPTVVREIPI